MKHKKLIALALTLVLGLQFSVMSVSFAEEQPSTPTENLDGTLTVVKDYSATEDTPALPEAITQGGQRYVLDDTSTAPAEGYEPPKQTYTRTLFSEVPISGVNNLGAYFPAVYPIDEGEYQGEIGLDPTTPFTVLERYEAFRVQVDRSTEFYGLPDNDVSLLPVYQDFVVSSSAYPGATTTASLQIVDVSFVVTSTDHLGYPTAYTALATYRGQEEILELHHYDVTANYSGEIQSSAARNEISGQYVPVTAEEEEIIIEEEKVPLVAPAVPIAEIGLVLTAAAATGGIVYLMTLLLRPFRVRNREDQTGKIHTVQRRRIKREKDAYSVTVKTGARLSYDRNMFGTLPQRYQNKGLQIKVMQNGIEVYEGDILPEMPLVNEITTFDEYVLQEEGIRCL